tara:strand:+ start:7682 stop:7906 length:225 start_codon:yes stop_codon:yes gene_type:complete
MRHLLNTLQEQALCQLEDEQQQEIIAEIQSDKTIDVYLKDTYEAGETRTSHMWSIDLDGQIQDSFDPMKKTITK